MVFVIKMQISPEDLSISICGASTNDRYKFGLYNVKIVHIPTQACGECTLDCDRHDSESRIDCRDCAMIKLRGILDKV